MLSVQSDTSPHTSGAAAIPARLLQQGHCLLYENPVMSVTHGIGFHPLLSRCAGMVVTCKDKTGKQPEVVYPILPASTDATPRPVLD